jgi:hypothetical protein
MAGTRRLRTGAELASLPLPATAGGPAMLRHPAAPPAEVRACRGTNFSYALPTGWTVGEEGPSALVLWAADQSAWIVVFGLSGLTQHLPPDHFAWHVLTQGMRLAPDLRLWNPRPIPPMPGCAAAMVLDVAYTLPDGPRLGLVFSHVAYGYGQCNGVMTLVASRAPFWAGGYATWLPQIAAQAVNIGPNAYGSTAIAATNQQIAQRDGAAAADYRGWSQSLWQQVADQRAASQDAQNAAMGPMLTGQQWMDSPWGGPATRASASPAVIWQHRDGRQLSSPDPGFDPRTPFDQDWRRMAPFNR